MYYITILDMFRAILCSSSGGLNSIVTASGIVTLCKRPYSTPVESGLSPLSTGTTDPGIRAACLDPYKEGQIRELDRVQNKADKFSHHTKSPTLGNSGLA
jgi:hypothetical protein